ncbi:MAG TPA: hypothetical protein VND97_01505 [Beijerinckiaceae bacterium]|nr:hypothetical protein [Beijerinckiaceae bacterium]
MASYKLFFLNLGNRIEAAEDLQASDDEEARALASTRLSASSGAAVELWCGARKVAVLSAEQRKDGAGRLARWLQRFRE